ncbi:hypothetical protein B566_EDAN010233 [Ephemera danica]|nr:hypothetical protein B566_EDAN010233 [Ephemera danica]
MVLSYIERRKFRDAIRQTWGAEDRFRVRTVFLMGIDSRNASVREEILRENEAYQDIVLADYEDTYHNNSIKYIMGLDWAVRFCSHSKFYILADDDAYFNVRKLLKYLASQLVPNDLIKKYPEMYGDFQNEELSNRVDKRKVRLISYTDKNCHFV